MRRAQVPGGTTDPVGKCRAVEVDALMLVDLRLSVERQVIGVFGDQHLGNGRFSRNATFDQPRGSCRLDDDFFAGPACIFGTARYQNAELGWHDVELLADVFADPMQAFATAGAVMAFDVDGYIDARQMGRKGTTVCPPPGDPFPAQIARCLLLIFQTVRLDLFGLFEPKEKLIFWKRLSATAEAVALQFLNDLSHSGVLELARKHHGLERVQVVGKLVGRHRHGRTTAHFDAQAEGVDAADSIGRGGYPAVCGTRASIGA